MVLTLLAWPRPANRRRPDASCTSTHESAEKLNRRRACPRPGTGSVPPAAAESTAAPVAAVTAGAPPGVVPSATLADSPPGAFGAAMPSAVTKARGAGPAVAAVRRACHGRHHRAAAAATNTEITATPATVDHGGARS